MAGDGAIIVFSNMTRHDGTGHFVIIATNVPGKVTLLIPLFRYGFGLKTSTIIVLIKKSKNVIQLFHWMVIP